MTSFVGSRHIYLENIVDERRKIIQKLRNWIECEMMTMAIFGQAYILKKNGLAKMTRVLREKCDKSQNTDIFAGKKRECCLNKNKNVNLIKTRISPVFCKGKIFVVFTLLFSTGKFPVLVISSHFSCTFFLSQGCKIVHNLFSELRTVRTIYFIFSFSPRIIFVNCTHFRIQDLLFYSCFIAERKLNFFL